MAEVAAARRPLLPPSSSSSLLPPPHRARPISLLAHATPQPARGRGREPRRSFGPPRRPSLLRCGFLRASPSLLRRGFLRAATTSGGGTLSPLPRRRPSLPPPSSLLLLAGARADLGIPSLLAGARADRHARRACPLAAPAAATSPAMPAAFAMRAVAATPAMPAALRGGRAGPLVVPRHQQRRRPRPPCPLRLQRSLRAPRPPRARRTGAAGPALRRGA